MAVMQNFDASVYDPAVIRAHAEQFDTALFTQKITAYVEKSANARVQRHEI